MSDFVIPTYRAGETVPDKCNFAYIIDSKGYLMYKKNKLFTAVTRVRENSQLQEIEEQFVISKKIPFDMFMKIEQFFRDVYNDIKSEAVVLLRFENNEWDVYVPEQEVGPGSAKYKNLPSGIPWAGSIHSHCNMSAFSSSIDDADELDFDGVHITIGRLGDRYAEYEVSLVSAGHRFGKLKLNEVVEVPEKPVVTTPKTWLDRVSEISRKHVREVRNYGTLWGDDGKETRKKTGRKLGYFPSYNHRG